MPVTAATAAMSTARPSHVSQVMTSRHPPYVASACETRSREWRSPSKADAFAVLAAVSASRRGVRVVEAALPLAPLAREHPAFPPPSSENKVFIYGPRLHYRGHFAP